MKRKILIATIVLSMMLGLNACGNSNAKVVESDLQEVKQDVIVENEIETAGENNIIEEITEKEIVDSISKIDETEGEVVTEESLTAEEWIESLELAEIKLVVWNELEHRGDILEKNQEYELKDGDRILLTTTEFENMYCEPEGRLNPPKLYSNYTQIDLLVRGKTEYTLNMTVDGKEIQYIFTLIALSDNINLAGDIEKKGIEWMKEMANQISLPTVVVLNDKTGKRVEIKTEDSYQLERGDCFYILKPTGYIYSDIIAENEALVAVDDSSAYYTAGTIDFSKIQEKTQLYITYEHLENGTITQMFTLLPLVD